MQTPTPAARTAVVTATAPQASTAPQPAAPKGDNPFAVFVGPQGPSFSLAGPRTSQDVDALKARREELSNQLQSVDSRRSKLMSQLRSTSDPVAVKGLEARLAQLDARQLQLENDLGQVGQMLSGPLAGVVASTSPAPRIGSFTTNQTMALSVLGIIFIGFPLAIGLAKSMWRRSTKPAIPPQALTETAQRLERLESSVDAIAIEIERISEGQRFVTRLLSDSQMAPALGAGSPETVRAK